MYANFEPRVNELLYARSETSLADAYVTVPITRFRPLSPNLKVLADFSIILILR